MSSPAGRPRKYDYEAIVLAWSKGGVTQRQLAERFGCSTHVIRMAIDPKARARQGRYTRGWIEEQRRPCKGGCGVLVWNHTFGRSGFCIKCAGKERRKVFAHGTESMYRRGCRCDLCRSESARIRREYRQRTGR